MGEFDSINPISSVYPVLVPRNEGIKVNRDQPAFDDRPHDKSDEEEQDSHIGVHDVSTEPENTESNAGIDDGHIDLAA